MDLEDKKEKLSALIDDELSMDEKSAFLEVLQQDESLQKSWQIFHLIKNVIKRNYGSYRSFNQPIVINSAENQDSQENPNSSK